MPGKETEKTLKCATTADAQSCYDARLGRAQAYGRIDDCMFLQSSHAWPLLLQHGCAALLHDRALFHASFVGS